MGSAISKFSPPQRKILVLGPPKTGKTAILNILSTCRVKQEGNMAERVVDFYWMSCPSCTDENDEYEEKKKIQSKTQNEQPEDTADAQGNCILAQRPFHHNCQLFPQSTPFNHIRTPGHTYFELSATIRKYWRCYYPGTDFLVFVLDGEKLKGENYEESRIFIDKIYNEMVKIKSFRKGYSEEELLKLDTQSLASEQPKEENQENGPEKNKSCANAPETGKNHSPEGEEKTENEKVSELHGEEGKTNHETRKQTKPTQQIESKAEIEKEGNGDLSNRLNKIAINQPAAPDTTSTASSILEKTAVITRILPFIYEKISSLVYKPLSKHSVNSCYKIKVPTLFFISKSDKLKDLELKEDLTVQLNIQKYFSKFKIKECNSSDRLAVYEGFDWLVEQVMD